MRDEDGLSVDLEYDMLRILQEIEEYRLGVVHGEDVWTKDRGERIALLVRFAKRMESQYDPTFDFKDSKNMPAGDLCPPAPNYVCGTKPEDIRDVAIRDEYITAIERNNAKARRFNAQLQIHRLIPMFPGFIDRFVIGLYTQPPSDRVHLIQALDQLRILDDRRTAIMKAVDSVIPPK